jgi:hypothetical protein
MSAAEAGGYRTSHNICANIGLIVSVWGNGGGGEGGSGITPEVGVALNNDHTLGTWEIERVSPA